jgi:hypothetical protein
MCRSHTASEQIEQIEQLKRMLHLNIDAAMLHGC